MTYGEFKKDAEKWDEANCLLNLWILYKAPLYSLIELWENYKNKNSQLSLF